MTTDMKKLLRELQRNGWTLTKGGKHFKLRHPDGKLFVISVSPKNSDDHKVLMQTIRRHERTKV